MKNENIASIIKKAHLKSGGEIITPGSLSPELTAHHLVELLCKVYVSHGITKNTDQVVEDLRNGKLQTWFSKSNGNFVATASLIHQSNGEVEIGRAVSLEKGHGKMLMLLAAQECAKNKLQKPIVAEVRAAKEFKGIPSGEATQHITLGLLQLVPHAIAPLFAHGDPLRQESFILARNDIKKLNPVTEQACQTLTNRDLRGPIPRVMNIQNEPFNIVVPSDEGLDISQLMATLSHELERGFTLFPIETTDRNLPLIGSLLTNPRVVLCGIGPTAQNSSHSVVLLGTVGPATLVAPSKIINAVPESMRQDLQIISDRFTSLGCSDSK